MKESICMLVASLVLAAGASAQTYPTRPIRFITVAAPGTVGDIIPRVVGQELAIRLKQPVVVEIARAAAAWSERPPARIPRRTGTTCSSPPPER